MKLFINYAAYRIEGFLLKFVSIRKAGGAAVGIVILTNLNIFLSILIILYRVFKIDFEKMFKFQWSEIALPFAIIITLFQMYLLFFKKSWVT